jgi:hypothetical protein
VVVPSTMPSVAKAQGSAMIPAPMIVVARLAVACAHQHKLLARPRAARAHPGRAGGAGTAA